MKKSRNVLGVRLDWKAFFYCFLAASTFWFFNAMNDNYNAVISYPVEVEYDEDKVIPVRKVPSSVSFNATGHGWNFLKKTFWFRIKPITIRPEHLPERSYLTSSELLPLVAGQLDDIKINYIINDTFYLPFDYLKEKKVFLTLNHEKLSLESGFKITSPVVISPDTIILKGPVSLLNQFPDSVRLDLMQRNIREDVEEEVKIENIFNPLLKISNNRAKVRFTVQPYVRESKVLPVIKSRFPFDENIQLSDDKVVLTYFVLEDHKDKAKPEDFRVELKFRFLDPADSTIKPVLIRKPDYIFDYYFTPAAVKIKYE